MSTLRLTSSDKDFLFSNYNELQIAFGMVPPTTPRNFGTPASMTANTPAYTPQDTSYSVNNDAEPLINPASQGVASSNLPVTPAPQHLGSWGTQIFSPSATDVNAMHQISDDQLPPRAPKPCLPTNHARPGTYQTPTRVANAKNLHARTPLTTRLAPVNVSQSVNNRSLDLADASCPSVDASAHPKLPENAGKENQPVQQSKRRSKAQGLGARTGASKRRKDGNSDDETAKLTPAQKKAAALKLPDIKPKTEVVEGDEKLSEGELQAVVDYICSPEVWETFKLKKATVFVKLSEILGKTAERIRRSWNDVWEKYKGCVALELHTGGGDGDEESQEATTTPGESLKRKRGKSMVEGIKYSRELLEQFRLTEIYETIDAVARDDPSVEREHTYTSVTPTSETLDDSSNEEKERGPLKKARKERGKTKVKVKKERGDSDSDDDIIVKAIVAMTENSRRRAQFEERKEVMKMALEASSSTNPRVRKMGEKLWLKQLKKTKTLDDSDLESFTLTSSSDVEVL